jgi:hypothetical protein
MSDPVLGAMELSAELLYTTEREANVVLSLAEALCKMRESNRELSTVKTTLTSIHSQ